MEEREGKHRVVRIGTRDKCTRGLRGEMQNRRELRLRGRESKSKNIYRSHSRNRGIEPRIRCKAG